MLIKKNTPLILSLLGNIIIALGIAILRVSDMGNDAFSAMTMSVSRITPFDLGGFQILVNIILIIFQLIWGRKYIGIGTIINMFLLGYVVQYSIPIIEMLIGQEGSHTFVIQIVIMMAAIFAIALGISLYQKANSGVAPFDFLSLGITEALPTPYFLNRMVTDASCIALALIPWFLGIYEITDCHIGIGTVMCVCGLGPFVSLWNTCYERIKKSK